MSDLQNASHSSFLKISPSASWAAEITLQGFFQGHLQDLCLQWL